VLSLGVTRRPVERPAEPACHPYRGDTQRAVLVIARGGANSILRGERRQPRKMAPLCSGAARPVINSASASLFRRSARVIHCPTVTLGVQRPYIPVHERPLVLHAEACASVTVWSEWGAAPYSSTRPAQRQRRSALPARSYVKPGQEKTMGF